MNGKLASTTQRPKHDTRQIILGLLVASVTLPFLSLAFQILFWSPISHFTGLAGFLSIMPAMGMLYSPLVAFPLILAIINAVGGPMWFAARAYGFDRYRHAAIAGAIGGGALSLAELVFLRGGLTNSTLREVLEFAAMLGLGALTGLIARKAAGAPKPLPDPPSDKIRT